MYIYLIERIHNIYRIFINTGCYLELQKFSFIITPVFKKAKRENIKNYIAAIKIIIPKNFEQIIHEKLNPLFRHVIILVYTEYRSDALEKNLQVDVVYTEFSKAFNKVNHNLLLKKVESLDVSGILYDWLKSYFTNKTKMVKIKIFPQK